MPVDQNPDQDKTQDVPDDRGKAMTPELLQAASNPRVWKSVCDRIGMRPNDRPERLGSGSSGTAFLLDAQTVLKFTSDKSEAEASLKISGKSYETLVNIKDVFGFKLEAFEDKGEDRSLAYVITQERLDKGDEDWKGWGELATFYFRAVIDQYFITEAIPQFKEWCELRIGESKKNPQQSQAAESMDRTPVIRRGKGRPVDSVKLFKEKDPSRAIDPDWGRIHDLSTIKPPTDEFFRWFKQLCDDLFSAGVEFHDLNGGNMMKRSGKHVVTDLGISRTTRPQRIDILAKVLRELAVLASTENSTRNYK